MQPQSREAIRIAVLTVSDGVANGRREDTSAAAIVDWAGAHGYVVAERRVVPDESNEIVAALVDLADHAGADVVLTTGGTGLTHRDVTPEATRAVLDREAPGIAERIRHVGAEQTPYAALSRGMAGTRGRTLIVNLPGSTAGVGDGLRVLEMMIEHAVQLLRGADTTTHAPRHG